MSGSLVPSDPYSGLTQAAPAEVTSWGPPAAPADGGSIGTKLSRGISALKRFRWLIIGTTVLGAVAGLVAIRFIEPRYEVNGSVWIADAPRDDGPIRPAQVLGSRAWGELITSFAILDSVAMRMQLYLQPNNPADSALFRDFVPGPDLRTGLFLLRVDRAGGTYALFQSRNRAQVEQERGVLGDSIGQSVGFRWAPDSAALAARGDVEFQVVTPREAAMELRNRLNVRQNELSQFMRLTLSGTRSETLARTMNVLLDEFIEAAVNLKRSNLVEFSNTLGEQLEVQRQNLTSAEAALETFKVNTATLPSENTPIPGGVTITNSPALSDFFNQRVAFETVRRDREALEQVVQESRGGRVRPEALLAVPAVVNSSPNLGNAIKDHTAAEGNLRAMRQKWTEQHPMVVQAREQLERMETVTLPQIAAQALTQLQRQEADLDRRIKGASSEIRQIPQRMIEEQRLTREVNVANDLYTNLKQNYAKAKLAEASAIPDVTIHDRAVAPERPLTNQAPVTLAAMIGGGLLLGVMLAILLDLIDRRFRYPEQASQELGLDVLGGIPTVHRTKSGQTRLEDAAQLVESFRALRLSVRNACAPNGPVAVTVTSPGPGDGKSFISSNLALSFAEAGYRTLLIDGDIRRGQLHTMFNVPQRPGLVDYLFGTSTLEEVILDTTHRNLSILPCGSRRQRGPELLASDETARVIRSLREQFDALIIDTAPLGAGIDPFALGAASGNLLLVLRTGKTDRKLAQAKLNVLDRMPVRLIGAVLNDIKAEGIYRYYSYLDGYGVKEDEPESPKPASLPRGSRKTPSGIS